MDIINKKMQQIFVVMKSVIILITIDQMVKEHLYLSHIQQIVVVKILQEDKYLLKKQCVILKIQQNIIF